MISDPVPPGFSGLNLIAAAGERLDTEADHVRPERDYKGYYKTAMVGHSAGGYLGATLAAMAAARVVFPTPPAPTQTMILFSIKRDPISLQGARRSLMGLIASTPIPRRSA